MASIRNIRGNGGRGKVKKVTGEYETRNSGRDQPSGSIVGKIDGNVGKIVGKVGKIDGSNNLSSSSKEGGGEIDGKLPKVIDCNHEEVSKLVEESSISDSKIRSTSYGSTIVEL